MKKPTKKIWKNSLTTFKDKKLAYVYVMNLILIVLIVLVSSLFYIYIRNITIETGNYAQFMQPDQMNEEQFEQLKSTLNIYIARVIISLIMLLIIIIALFSTLSGIIWNKLLKKKTAVKKLAKFFGLNIIIIILYILVIYLLLKILVPTTAITLAIIFTLALFYYAPVLYYNFFKEKRMKDAFRRSVVGFKKATLAIPFISTIILIIISVMVSLLFLRYANYLVSIIAFVLLINLSLSYYKTFIFESLQIVE